ncbi:hypothetical protein [Pedobacter africanus]|uniref:Uncharacterized protein n=1 Tax=Pedobacter africanus TaxID=151894 RepID=A0A1W1ZCV6_9SPHI|nr:hypothetical protein [Pedobacter africanus]SMC46275.1 hypothetical protein SAMN04488524_0610 [Pedobacter africanus]
MNIDQLEMDLCRQQAVISLIKRSADKAKHIACSSYYGLFEPDAQRKIETDKQNKVTERLVNYLRSLKVKEAKSWI